MSFQLQGGSAANNDYDYESGSGLDSFLSRSIDEVSWQTTLGSGYNTLSELPIGTYPTSSTPTNYDATQVSGSLSGVTQAGGGSGTGNSSTGGLVTIDATNGKISVFDTSGNEVVRLGNLGN